MKELVSERSIRFQEFLNTSPMFKGLAVMFLGAAALLFSYYLVKKWNEPRTISFYVFVGFAAFVVLYGLFILIFQPAWWIPPWWN